jgi:hypothetical protein
MPLPVQPFAAEVAVGISTTQLGPNTVANHTVTEVAQGERAALPWIYSGAGFSVERDADITDGTDVGSAWSNIDINCDGVVDTIQLNCTVPKPADSPLRWLEATTNVTGTDEAYLTGFVPPLTFPWLLRHKAIIDHVCVGPSQLPAPSALNAVYATIPFSPTNFNNKQAFVAVARLGGSPDTPPSKVCLDSPQSGESVTNVVYHNPPLKGDAGGPVGVGGRALDDGSGLYVRWTVLQSIGSISLNRAGDLRKPYQSPPSIPSDTGYVERIVQLECFWMDDDGCTACDGDTSGFISPEESWADPDLLAMTGTGSAAAAKAAIDKDGDCLMNSTYIQPNWPAVDLVDDPTGKEICDAADGWVIYSENPVLVTHNEAEDRDCDGLVDGIEWFWGGNDLVTSKDFDNDGAPDFVEMFQFTSPKDADTDDDGYADKPSNVYGTNTDTSMDNCPTVKNGTGVGEDNQANTDGGRVPNGPNIPNAFASNPNQDKLGDACDVDNDNDLATDVYETNVAGTNPLKFDTDGDTVGDGMEIHAGPFQNGDPLAIGTKPTWDGTNDQIYYRGCQINVNTAYAGYTEQDGTADGVEMDVDGDGGLCPTDGDSDTYMPGKKAEVLDKYEAFGYGLLIANQDTDGDGCADWVEIHDLNGDRTANSTDVGLMNKRFAGKIASDCTGTYPACAAGTGVSDKMFDVNKDGSITSADTGQMNKNNCLYKSGTGGCGAPCAAEPNG